MYIFSILLAQTPVVADEENVSNHSRPEKPRIPWSSDLLDREDVWSEHLNEALVSGTAAGLRVEIAPGKTWAIAAVSGVQLPEHTGKVRARVVEKSDTARWLARIYGDLRDQGGAWTTGPIQDVLRTGEREVDIDPRILHVTDGVPLQVQVGLEGEPGDYAVFDLLEFLPGPVLPDLDEAARAERERSGQIDIACVDYMTRIPNGAELKDWRATAVAFDRLAFDLDAEGEHLPLIWLDDSRINIDRPTFGLPSYVGDSRQSGSSHEGLTCLGAVLGASLAGIDKAAQRHDYVLMCEAYFNARNGLNVVLNYTNQTTGGSFWYEIWPAMVFYGIAHCYPDTGGLESIMRTTADRWLEAYLVMGGDAGSPDFNHTAFDFVTMQPANNEKWKEPDAAAGVAWLEYMAWTRFGDGKYLEAADRCLAFLDERIENPYYEILLPYGAYLAARMNAELGRDHDVRKLVDWCFGISDCRGGWGVMLGDWGGYDCSGLVGSIDNQGGYAFVVNTFAQAGALVPLVRYDARYARAIGKWMLHVAGAARLFYPDALPDNHQSSASWKQVRPECAVSYEGLRKQWDGKSPVAMGDPLVLDWGPATDLAMYGGAYAGILGGIVGRTNHEAILQLDCLVTDFFHAPAYPTYLYYNPYDSEKTVELDVGPESRNLYDAATHRFLAKNVGGAATFTLAADTAAVVVVVPADGETTRDGAILSIDGVAVDFACPNGE